MRDEDQTNQDNIIMGFSNPITESPAGVADSTDGRVTVLGYRPLTEDGGVKGKMRPSDRLAVWVFKKGHCRAI